MLLFAAAALLLFAITFTALVHLKWARRLPPSAAVHGGEEEEPDIQCSVVVAARDEEARIEESVRRLLTQRGVRLEVIVVDDRSTDRTGEILRGLASNDDRLRVVRVEALPAGWLGKCHACHLGASAATGRWILFTDADCWLTPDGVARALEAARREQADHIVLTPGIVGATTAARAWHLAMLMSLTNWFAGVNRDRPEAYLGMGAFNLVRATAYGRCGGYEALRLTVVDDLRLGLLLRRSGARTRAFIGGDDTACQWGTTAPAMIKIMEKNYFALMDFRLARALTAGFGGALIWCVAIVGPFTGTIAGAASGVALLSLIAPALVLSRRLGWGAGGALLTPFIHLAMFYAIVNSALTTVRQGGVWWRDTFYPLDTLRKGAVSP